MMGTSDSNAAIRPMLAGHPELALSLIKNRVEFTWKLLMDGLNLILSGISLLLTSAMLYFFLIAK